MKLVRPSYIAGFLVLAFVGYVTYCKVSRHGLQLMGRPILEQDLYGEWRLSPDTLVVFERHGLKHDNALHECRIMLRVDGTASLKVILPRPSGRTGYTFSEYELEGRWQVHAAPVRDFWRNGLEMSFDHDLSRFNLFVTDESDGLRLWRYWNDPDDAWERLCFTKRVR